MLILGIESSCDDTSVALLDSSDKGHIIVAEKSASQIPIHTKYGGVVPEIAGRMHAEKIVPLIEAVLSPFAEASADRSEAQATATAARRGPAMAVTTPPSLPLSSRGGSALGGERGGSQLLRPDVIAVTAGPGLITGLIVGVEAARTLSWAWNIPLVAVNHIEGHIHSVEITNDKFQIPNQVSNDQLTNKPTNQFPALCLVVSGGHTELVLMKDHGEYDLLGATKDDAAGECFDKVAKLLGLPYPGGPEISRLAQTGNPSAIQFPRPMLKENNYDFSFAGLKTSALYWLRDHDAKSLTSDFGRRPKTEDRRPSAVSINDFCASIEQAIVDVLVAKTMRAALQYHPKTIILCGGVAANQKLRKTFATEVHNRLPATSYQLPADTYCMDNGAMIAAAGYYHALKQDFINWGDIRASPNWKIA